MKNLKKYFENTKIMVIWTVDEKWNPYSSTVYFGYDEEYNLYFLSNLRGEHAKHILSNWKISAWIINSEKYDILDKDKQWLQIQWNCKLIEDDIEAMQWFKYIVKHVPNVEKLWENKPACQVLKEWWHRIFKFKPNKIKIWDEGLYSDEWKEVIFN